MINPELSPDTQAILLLCASFGQNRNLSPQPLNLSEYNTLASWLQENQMRPGDLLSITAKSRLQNLALNKLDSQRIEALLARGMMLSLAVEKWTQQGLWILGRGDRQYPIYIKQKLKQKSPPILYGIGNIELLSAGGLAIVGSRDVGAEEIAYTQSVAKICAAEGMQVVSGGAQGIDKVAMLEALAAGGTVVGVLADSLSKMAVNGKYRSSIAEGKLTLISAYDPNSSFSTGNAMGRNKYIYALADYALVVSSAWETGGTWTGAKEALEKIKEVPVFVRIDDNIPEGNRQLVKLGAKSFPLLPGSDFKGELKSLLAATELEASDRPESVVEEIQVEPGDRSEALAREAIALDLPKDIYTAVLPLILNHLNKPIDTKSLAEKLEVRQGQMQDWLNRAIAEGKAIKIDKPVRYVINKQADQLSLLSNNVETLS